VLQLNGCSSNIPQMLAKKAITLIRKYNRLDLRMSKSKVVAQFTFIPLQTENPDEHIDRLLEMAAQNDVEMEVNDLSTTIRGDYSDILDLIREIYETMAMEGVKFRFHVEMLSPIAD
jgi:uncharacterized protein YqgV (UPF0045/DUF77 family)